MATSKAKSINGYVAYLDILGFSELVQRESFSKEFDQYSEILSNAVRTNNRGLQYVTFSDSVVINTREDGEEHLQHLIQAISEITFNFLIQLGVPICGCVSRGQFWRHKSRHGDTMLAGQPIIDAYRFEQEQDWVGVMLSPQVLKFAPALHDYSRLKPLRNNKDGRELEKRFPWPLLIHRYPMVPFRKPNDFTDRTYDGFVIVPQRSGCADPTDLVKDLDLCNHKLDDLMTFAPEPSAQRKYQATKNWIHRLKRDWHTITKLSYWSNRHQN